MPRRWSIARLRTSLACPEAWYQSDCLRIGLLDVPVGRSKSPTFVESNMRRHFMQSMRTIEHSAVVARTAIPASSGSIVRDVCHSCVDVALKEVQIFAFSESTAWKMLVQKLCPVVQFQKLYHCGRGFQHGDFPDNMISWLGSAAFWCIRSRFCVHQWSLCVIGSNYITRPEEIHRALNVC